MRGTSSKKIYIATCQIYPKLLKKNLSQHYGRALQSLCRNPWIMAALVRSIPKTASPWANYGKSAIELVHFNSFELNL